MDSVSTGSELHASQWNRNAFLAQPRNSKTVWATTPWALTWGNQDSIWPVSRSALRAVPSSRIKALAQHKQDTQLRKEEEEEWRMMKKIPRRSSHIAQYENIVRLATPKTRVRSSQEVSSSHSELCEYDCPIWHLSPCVRNAIISPRILQLANPKTNHPNFTGNRQNEPSFISYAAKTAKMTPRLELLSLPKLRENRHFYDHRRPESPIRPVSRGARNATVSTRIQGLSTPKPLSKDYIPPREPAWRS
ncbi:testicular haploid expressed gene protein-like isoform X2 [Xyrauchen texanus]|uniref:testicular haploid expressed gene protein-like isoform X2 n=1 Tax=Xyrauchen texanus TaxID=154827 RepID=UPI002241F3A0|nr:testicular haploid expressed gene protein-like isoform X2 [Xyrauchen texanus]